MSTLQYPTPTVSREWAASRETHSAVAMAIHAVSGPGRTPEQIWEDPTQAEFDHVRMAVQNYVSAGVFDGETDHCYAWGCAVIVF